MLNRLPAPATLGPRGRRAVVSVVLAAGVGVTGSTALASSAAALLSDTTSGALAATASDLTDPMAAAAEDDPMAADGVGEQAAPAPAYVAAGNAAVGVPGAAPHASMARVLRKERPTPPPITATSVVLPSISAERWINPLPGATVTSCFGMRWGRPHEGVDLAAPDGTPIRAAGAGQVVAAGPEQGYGNAVLIDHHDGYLTHYAHLSVITVRVGDQVAADQQIGDEGSTGHSTGPHLHFEVHAGYYQNPVEPTAWLRAHGVDIPGCTAAGSTPR